MEASARGIGVSSFMALLRHGGKGDARQQCMMILFSHRFCRVRHFAVYMRRRVRSALHVSIIGTGGLW